MSITRDLCWCTPDTPLTPYQERDVSDFVVNELGRMLKPEPKVALARGSTLSTVGHVP